MHCAKFLIGAINPTVMPLFTDVMFVKAFA
jgi:hypothetical protein